MTAFATPSDLALRLNIAIADDDPRATALLESASDLIREVTGQTVDLTNGDVLTRQGAHVREILLPQLPVVSVASVTLDGDEITDFWLEGNKICRMRGWGQPWQTLVITYTHGYATPPTTLKVVVCEVVMRVWWNAASVNQTTSGDVETIFTPSAGLYLTEDEEEKVRRFFGMTEGSVRT